MNKLIDYPSSFTEREKSLYLEYLINDSLLPKNQSWYMGAEKYNEVQVMQYKLSQNKKSDKNYFKNKFGK